MAPTSQPKLLWPCIYVLGHAMETKALRPAARLYQEGAALV